MSLKANALPAMAAYDPKRHHRRSVRLRWHDYADAGWYAVTLCAHRHHHLFGECTDGVVALSPYGQVVWSELASLAARQERVSADAFVVMPNHVHCIVVLRDLHAGIVHKHEFHPPPSGSLGATMASLKGRTARTINALRQTPNAPVWQRSYWDRVIRDEAELDRIRDYIAANPARWAEDRYNA